jgi:hypothetical protein
MDQFELFNDSPSGMAGKNATHSAGRGETFHDWFPYLEGFSSSFVKTVRRQYLPESTHIIEPFAGIGTTPIYLAEEGIDCSYCEINPILLHLIKTKTSALTSERDKRFKIAERLLKISSQLYDVCKKAVNDPIADLVRVRITEASKGAYANASENRAVDHGRQWSWSGMGPMD